MPRKTRITPSGVCYSTSTCHTTQAASRSVSVLFNIDPAMTKVNFNGLAHRFFAAPRFYYQFDLGFNLVEEPEGLRVECDFNTNLFDGEVLQTWLAGYESLLREITTGDQQTIALLPMTEKANAATVTGPTVDIEPTATVYTMGAAQMKRTPTAVALHDGETTLTYRDLEEQVERLATQPPDSPDNMHGERSIATIVAMLATLKAGGLPPGVEVSQPALANFLQSMQREPGLTESDVVLAQSPFNAGVSLTQWLLPLTVGATCVVASDEVAADVDRLSTVISNAGIYRAASHTDAVTKTTQRWLAG